MSCGEPCQKSAHMASEFSGRQLATGRRRDTGRREAVDSRVTSRVVYSHSSTSSSDVVYAVSTGRGRSGAPRFRPAGRARSPPATRTRGPRRARSAGAAGPRAGRGRAGTRGTGRAGFTAVLIELSSYPHGSYMKLYIEVSTIVPREPSTEARGQKALGGRVGSVRGGSNQGSTTGGGAVASGRVRGRRTLRNRSTRSLRPNGEPELGSLPRHERKNRSGIRFLP